MKSQITVVFFCLVKIIHFVSVTFKFNLFVIATNCGHQGRKSMFKHGGGDNIGEKYTSRLWDVLRGALPRALLGGFGGMLPPKKKFKWCNLVRFGVYLDQILSLKNFKD